MKDDEINMSMAQDPAAYAPPTAELNEKRYVVASFFAPGVPAPGGSKKGFYAAKLKRVVIVDDAGERNKNWRAVVALAARSAYRGAPVDEALAAEVVFMMPRPKNHYRKNGQLKPSAPLLHATRPDATKLWRSTEDALKGIIYRDDCLIADQRAVKIYGETTGAQITIYSADQTRIYRAENIILRRAVIFRTEER